MLRVVLVVAMLLCWPVLDCICVVLSSIDQSNGISFGESLAEEQLEPKQLRFD